MSSHADFLHRKSLAWVAFWEMEKLWRANHLPINLKVNIFKASVVSVLLYGCELWVYDASMVDQINSLATSCYMIMLDIRRLDKVPNVDVLARVNQRELINAAYKRQLQWLGQALNRDADEPSRIFALYEPAPSHGSARPGRRPTTFYEHIASILSPSGMSVNDIVDAAKNEKEWKKKIAVYG